MTKNKVYLLGLVTLLLFPVPTFIYRIYWKDETFLEILEIDSFWHLHSLYGLLFGILYARISLYFLQLPVFKKELAKQQDIVSQLNLNAWDAIFLSLCAGIGEELLFRAGIQAFLGPIITTIIFIAIHGYLNPKNWRLSLYGILLLPFILIISYGFDISGLWFAIAAHAAYDWILFNNKELNPTEDEPFIEIT